MVKLYSWIAYDVSLFGLIGYNFVILKLETFANALDSLEKFILFLCTVALAWYRIDILRSDAKRKRIDNVEREIEIYEKRGGKSA